MERVLGLGGVFFKSKDPAMLSRWYVANLGLPGSPDGDDGISLLRWQRTDPPNVVTHTVWAPFPADTDYFQPSPAPFMVNFQVANLDAMLAQLRAAGVTVDDRVERSEYGDFGWCLDPEGNRIELWQPPAAKAELLQSIAHWRGALERAILAVPAERHDEPGVEGDLSVKDLVHHVTFWENRAHTLLRAAVAGSKAPSLKRPDEGEGWMNRVNAEVQATGRSLTWDEVWQRWGESSEALAAVIAPLSERDLFGVDGLARFIGATPWDIIAGNTFDHYSEHLVSIRAWSNSQVVK